MNKITNRLMAIYYKLKYNIKSKDGAAAIFIGHIDDKKKKEFDARLDKIANGLTSNYKSILELEQYIIQKYNAKKSKLSDR